MIRLSTNLDIDRGRSAPHTRYSWYKEEHTDSALIPRAMAHTQRESGMEESFLFSRQTLIVRLNPSRTLPEFKGFGRWQIAQGVNQLTDFPNFSFQSTARLA